MSKIIDNAYESIKGYLPEDAKLVIDKQRKRIDKEIDVELESFREYFSKQIEQTITEFEQEMERTVTEFSRELNSLTDKMKQEVTDNSELNSTVQALSGKLDKYDAVVKKLASATKTAIKAAANSAGLPI